MPKARQTMNDAKRTIYDGYREALRNEDTLLSRWEKNKRRAYEKADADLCKCGHGIQHHEDPGGCRYCNGCGMWTRATI